MHRRYLQIFNERKHTTKGNDFSLFLKLNRNEYIVLMKLFSDPIKSIESHRFALSFVCIFTPEQRDISYLLFIWCKPCKKWLLNCPINFIGDLSRWIRLNDAIHASKPLFSTVAFHPPFSNSKRDPFFLQLKPDRILFTLIITILMVLQCSQCELIEQIQLI